MALENALDYEGLKHYDGKSKEYIEKKITDLDSEKVDKTTVATSSTLGLVKSGTDITVDSSGNVSVNDNSHKHTVSNISDLTATASELNVLDGITATTTELNYVDGVTSNIQTQLNSKVPTARKVNGKALSSDITLSASDVGADASGSASSALSDAKDYTDSKIASEVTARNSAIDTAKSSAISTASTDATTKANNALASAKTYTDTKTANLASTSTVDDKISAHNTSTSAHSDIRGSISTLQTEVTTHKNTSNPHGINKSTIGLGNVENKSSATIRSEITKDNVKSALGYTPAELDANGKVPSSQLPSYVDDTIEGYLYNGKFYKESAHTTVITGESGKIYVDLSNNKTYRWSGSAYVVISETLALGETSSTAYRGDRGKIAYDHSQSAHFSGNYNDLTNKPTIPTVGNGTITITQNGVSKGTFTTNQSGNTTIELTDTNTDTKYTLPSAGASLGGVKSGGDVTISGGVITVNDDSHNHVISNVDGLQSSLDSKASILSDMTKFPVNYGFAVARCGNTIGTSGGSDNYYMLADSSNDFRVGTQLNGASTVTWTKFSKDGHTHNDKLNKAVTNLGAMTDKTITDLQNNLNEWLKTCYETPNTRATFTANPSFISLWNNNDTATKISAGANWTAEIETYYAYHNYVLLKLTTYSSKQVYYVEKSNGTWGKITKVSFDGETATTATALTSKSIGTTKQPVYFDANGKPVAISYTIEKSVPSNAVFTDTNTHYTTGITAGASGTTSNAAASNPYIKIKDDSTHRGQIQLKGGGATTVSSDANGVITISSTDTNTKYTHPNSGVTAGTYRSVTVNAQGHVTAGSNPTLTVAQGGTGATDAATARSNLGITPANIGAAPTHSHLYAGSSTQGGAATLVAGETGANDVYRHVWFSDSNTETKRNYNDDFKYNPSTNTLSVANVSGKSATATKLATARTIALGTGATGTATSFDGSGNITIPVTEVKEAYLTSGGRNLSGAYSPIDAAMVPELGANRLAFMPAAGITVEYSQDGGSTWSNYSLSDASKIDLFNGNGTTIRIGNSTATKTDKSKYMVRVTIDTSVAQVYTYLNKFVIYCSTEGSTGSYCTIQGRTQGNYSAGTNTWKTFVDKAGLSGWSGYNVINTGFTTYGNTNEHYRQVRFTFGVTRHSNSVTYPGLSITKIMGFGGVGWTTPSTMASKGRMYTYDASKNVTFPKKVKAESFEGALTGIASSANKLNTNAGSSTKGVYFADGKPVDMLYTLSADVVGYCGSLASGGWKALGGKSSGKKIYVAYNNKSASWNSDTYSSSIVFGCEDTKGLLDCGYNKPIVTFGGGSTGVATDDAPTWYFKLEGTSGKTYKMPSSDGTLVLTTGSITGSSGSCTGNSATATALTSKNIGTTKQPVYFDANGKPAAISYTIEKSVPSNAVFTDTDTKVTSVGNHYTPSADSNATLSADASSSTAATWNSTSLVTGVNLQRDAKGHVTGVTVDSIKMPTNPNSDTNTAHSHSAGVGLVGSGKAGTSGTYTYKAKLRSETALTVDSAAATTTSGKVYPVAVDKSGYLAVNVPWTDTNTDTHYTTGLKVGASATATANAAATNGNVYLNVLDNTTVRDSHKIVGSGSVTVTSDANGVITIKGTDTNDKYTHPTYTARTGKPTANQTPAFGGTATISQITSDGTGHVTGMTDRTITIPSTLSNGTGTAGLIKTTSTVTSNSGYTACPVINGVPYYKDTDSNTDTKVTQTVKSDNAQYPILLAPSGQTATKTTTACFDSGVTLNPSTNTINANISGNATKIENSVKTETWLKGNKGTALINSTADAGSFVAINKTNSTNGYFVDATYQHQRLLAYTKKETVDAGTNSVTYQAVLLNESGNSSFPGELYAKRFKGDGVKNLTAKTSLGVVSLTDDGLMIPTIGTLAWWNGQWKDGYSNLMYCNKGAFGDACIKGVDTTPTASSTNLITSGAMYTALTKKLSKDEIADKAQLTYQLYTNYYFDTSAHSYYLSFHKGGYSIGADFMHDDGIRYDTISGTSSVNGYGILVLGNNKKSGVGENRYGGIMLFGTSTFATKLLSGAPSAERTITLPNQTGTLSIASSDIRLKENIKDTEEQNALSVVNSIKFRQFDWKESGRHQKIGVIADELELIDEHLVLENTGGYYEETDEDGNPEMNVKCVDTFYLMGYYGKAIQELSAENNSLKEEIKELKDLVLTLINK